MLGPAALSSTTPGFAPDSYLVQLALARKLEDIYATILSVKATADHAQQVASSAQQAASSALNMASAATAAAASACPNSRRYPKTAPEPRCPSSQGQSPSPLRHSCHCSHQFPKH